MKGLELNGAAGIGILHGRCVCIVDVVLAVINDGNHSVLFSCFHAPFFAMQGLLVFSLTINVKNFYVCAHIALISFSVCAYFTTTSQVSIKH